MKDYMITNKTSCVYDAFKAAGIPVTDSMLKGGIKAKEIIKTLVENGYRVFTDGDVAVPDEMPLFIMMQKPTSSVGHLEYHYNAVGLDDEYLQGADVLMIAVKIKN